jgi:cell fate (sporulation/competence/biofilm development) regulator YmcA (YheA/YmcA/DUF963 family)
MELGEDFSFKFFCVYLYFMDELFEITKDYFKKTEVEQEELFLDIFVQLELLMIQSNLHVDMVLTKLESLQEKCVELEMYELAELYRKLNHKIKEIHGNGM